MSLRKQLSLVLSLLFLAMVAVILWVSVAGTRQYLEQQLASHAQDAATTLSVSLGQSLGKQDQVLAEAQVGSMFDRGYFKRIDVLGPDRSPILRRELPEKIKGVPDWFVAAVPINTPTGEAFVGSGWRQLGKVLVVSQPTFAYQHLWSTSVQLLAWLLLICGVALALVQVGLHFMLMPLRAIEKMAKNVQAKQFGQIEHEPRAPELARVVQAMNNMSRRVAEMLDADAAKVQALHKQAYQDELTGLANRRGFELRLGALLQGEHQFALGAVVSVELDDMRLLNRAHGFAAGEHIMQVVADSAREVFSTAPVAILARSNEFSFNFVLADLMQSQVEELAAGLRRKIMARLAGNTPAQMVAINIGAAFFRQQDKRTDVFARADLAVESARQSSRHGFVVMPDTLDDNSSLGSFGWRTLIQTALAENRWRLVHQPVLNLDATHTVLQGECMARLVDAKGELIPASTFMPMAARHRLMPDVDRAMVLLALDYVKQTAQETTLVAINLSQQSMADAAFMAWFAGRLVWLGVGARRLAVEVSEFGVLRQVPAAIQMRDLVRRHGGKFGIDHFNLDAQALHLLREVLPDYVKLTGALTTEIETGESAGEMLRSFVKLAHSLDITVIAQQVESSEQVTALTADAVDAAQGYYFGVPQ